MATYSRIFVWETPWTEEPGQGYSPVGLQKVKYNLATKTRTTTNHGGEG